MVTNDTKSLSAQQQIAEMGQLKQDAAAWLVGYKSSRSLREAVDAPRNPDGKTFDGRRLVEWARDKPVRAKLTDAEMEAVRQAADSVGYDILAGRLVPIIRLLDSLVAQHGDAGMLTLVDAILDIWRAEAAEAGRHASHQDYLAAARAKQEEWTKAREELRIAYVCQHCKKLRQGDTWKAIPAPAGSIVCRDECPECVPSV